MTTCFGCWNYRMRAARVPVSDSYVQLQRATIRAPVSSGALNDFTTSPASALDTSVVFFYPVANECNLGKYYWNYDFAKGRVCLFDD